MNWKSQFLVHILYPDVQSWTSSNAERKINLDFGIVFFYLFNQTQQQLIFFITIHPPVVSRNTCRRIKISAQLRSFMIDINTGNILPPDSHSTHRNCYKLTKIRLCTHFILYMNSHGINSSTAITSKNRTCHSEKYLVQQVIERCPTE